METFVYTVAFAQALLCMTALIIRRNQAGVGIFLCVVAVVLFRTGLELAIHGANTGYKGLSLGLLMASALWLSPILLSLSKPLVDDVRQTKKSLVLQWSAPLLGLLCVFPLMLTAHNGSDYQNAINPFTTEHWLVVNSLQFVAVGIFAVQVPLTIHFAWHHLKVSSAQNHPLFSIRLEAREHLVRVAILMISATWFAALLRVCHCAVIGGPSNISLVFSAIEVLLLMFGIVWVLIHAQEQPVKVRSAPKYARSALDFTVENRINKKLSILYCDEVWLGQAALGLNNLCQQINENPHYVSQVLNQAYQGGFFEWLHRARIEHACKLLADDSHIAIKDVIEASGFSAKSTFNTAFKRYQGCTPSAFRQQKAYAPAVPNA
jgi:AraC-like DNA-binding protein